MNNNPTWLKNAVFYEIYPQSFNDTNADGIGDFNGIIEKLDYIKELGCNALWLNPCFESPFGDAGYDVSDYYSVAARYGTNEDLKRLFNEVHRRDMHILLDLVPGHTSVEHKWFKESMKAERNRYTDRYIWTNSVWERIDGGATLRGISDRDGCCLLNFFSHQPALNYGYYEIDPDKKWQLSMDDEGPKATLEELKNIMRFWLSMGCDGFRVDMAYSLVKNDPESKGTIKLWQNVREFLDEEFPTAAMIAEWGEPDKALAGGFHMDFLLHFGPSHYMDLFRTKEPYFSSRAKGDLTEFIATYKKNYEKSGKGLICIPSGNHDMDRMARTLGIDEMRLAFAFLLSMPGAPFIYYGDEIGMRFVENLVSVEGGYSRTGARSPMQWDSSTNAGFSTAPAEKLYIRLDPDVNRPTVEKAMADKNSLWYEVQGLIALRKANEALQAEAEVEFVETGYPLIYKRKGKTQTVTVIINPSLKEFERDIDGEIIYTVGNSAEIRNKKCYIRGSSAVFILN